MQEPVVLVILGTAVGLIFGFIGAQLIAVRSTDSRRNRSVRESEGMIDEAKKQASEIEQQAERKSKEEIKRRNRQAEKELARRRHELDRRNRKLNQRESAVDRRQDTLSQQEQEIKKSEVDNKRVREEIEASRETLERTRVETIRRCEEVSGLTSDQAQKLLLELLEGDVRQDAAAMVRRIETETREVASKKARQIVTLAIQRCASDQVGETTVSVLSLPNDDMKGRIIGKEGRNIRALEAATDRSRRSV